MGVIVNLPEPALAIAIVGEAQIAYLAASGEELYVESSDGHWQRYPLPDRFPNIQRLLVRQTFCYILASRKLTLCDLRDGRNGVVAENVDDAVLSSYGELWLLEEFSLVRTSPLGRELERRTMSSPASSLWMVGDSLLLSDGSKPAGVPQSCLKSYETIENYDLTPANFASGERILLFLLDPWHVLRVRCGE